MKHKAKVIVETEKKGLFGTKKFREERVIEVDEKTYRKMKKEQRNRPFTTEELLFYDEIFDAWDD